MPILVGPSALWPTQPKFWVGHGPPGPRCSAPHVVAGSLRPVVVDDAQHDTSALGYIYSVTR